MTKSDVIRLRIDPELKARVFAAAETDGRSASNYIERLLRRELDKAGNPDKAERSQ